KKPIDEQAVREIFARLEFRTMLDRLFKAEGIGENGDGSGATTTATGAAAETAPTPQNLLDEELGAWLTRAVAAHPDGLGFTVDVLDGKPAGMGISTPTESVSVAWQPGRADYAPFEEWLASRAAKLMTDAKRQLKALKNAGLPFAGIAYDTHIAG